MMYISLGELYPHEELEIGAKTVKIQGEQLRAKGSEFPQRTLEVVPHELRRLCGVLEGGKRAHPSSSPSITTVLSLSHYKDRELKGMVFSHELYYPPFLQEKIGNPKEYISRSDNEALPSCHEALVT